MERRLNLLNVSLALIVLVVLSCVTVNIYFPAEEVRRTAEEIVEEVRQPAPMEQSRAHSPVLASCARWLNAILLPFRVSSVHAQSETTVSNAAIRAIKQRMKARTPQLLPYFDQGVIGETNKGYVQVRDSEKLDMKSRAAVKRLVDAENLDRRQLYQEVARALNIQPSQVQEVEAIFAEEWQKSARPGWYIQNANGQWVRR